ncbi:MAG: hypothetical protein GXP33_12960, partial [Spirochaetes bacterium]|nr:hypothetical protein [Spirochaetota bacterium]
YEQSKNINNIIKVISDISSKTHILSINASIVSARAGVHGKTFEVVSKEIRNLAMDTEKSSKKIEEEIHNIQETIKLAVDTIRMAVDQNSIERKSLISVVGSLQGVMLGVEVIRTVSDETKEKSNTQVINFSDIFTVLGNVNGKISFFFDMQAELKNEIVTASKELEKISEMVDK